MACWVRYYVADYSTQIQLVAAGLTTALVPRMAAPASHPDIRLIPCTPDVTRTVSVATAEETETPAVHAFTAALTRAAQQDQTHSRNEETEPGRPTTR